MLILSVNVDAGGRILSSIYTSDSIYPQMYNYFKIYCIIIYKSRSNVYVLISDFFLNCWRFNNKIAILTIAEFNSDLLLLIIFTKTFISTLLCNKKMKV